MKRTFCGFSKIVFSSWNTDWKWSWTEKDNGMEDFFNRSENVEVRCKGGKLGGGGDEGVGSCAGSVGLAMLNELLFVVKRKEGTRVV